MEQIADNLVVPVILTVFLAIVIFILIVLRKLVRSLFGREAQYRRRSKRSEKSQRMIDEGFRKHMARRNFTHSINPEGVHMYHRDVNDEITVLTWRMCEEPGFPNNRVSMSAMYTRGYFKSHKEWVGHPLKVSAWNDRPIRFRTKNIDKLIKLVTTGK